MSKRFKYVMFDGFMDNGEYMHPSRVVELLNNFYEENERLKQWNKCLAEKRHEELQNE